VSQEVRNPPNSDPIVLERVAIDTEHDKICSIDGKCDPDKKYHTKALYRLTKESQKLLKVLFNCSAV
jgi:hypothetical protein